MRLRAHLRIRFASIKHIISRSVLMSIQKRQEVGQEAVHCIHPADKPKFFVRFPKLSFKCMIFLCKLFPKKCKKRKAAKPFPVLPLFSSFFSAPPYGTAELRAFLPGILLALEHLLNKASDELHIRAALYLRRNHRHDLTHVLNGSRTDFGYRFLHNLLDLVFV